jgi:hypothetical protein
MQKIGAGVATGLLVAAISFSAPSAAFALGLGPFHISLPSVGRSFAHRHRPAPRTDFNAEARICDDTGSPEAARKALAQDASSPASALLYPSLALPTIYGNVFWPPSSLPWPFGYDAIFHAAFGKAFGKTAGDENRCSCQADRGSAVIERIGKEIRLGTAQRPRLQKLGGALAVASGFLAKFCPKEIPARPVARLKVMETQLEVLTMALDIIRGPLQDFEQSLDRNQRAHLAAMFSAQSVDHKNAAEFITPACGMTPTAVNWSIDELDQSLKPDETQRTVMAAIKQAFGRAASDLDAQCPVSLPAAPLARLETLQARLDAEWRAVLTIQAALANLEDGLSDDQRVRFNTLDFTAR